jgi:putative aldouronate transport system substrate-binding protein
MKRCRLKILCLLVVVLMITTATACNTSTSSMVKTVVSSTADGKSALKLKPVELSFYMVGDAPKDLKLVEDKINILATKDMNATVKFNYTTWTDYATKYNLVLSTGQPIDLIYTASWLEYQKLARKGAFRALDELLPLYAPALQKFVPEDYWNQVKIEGKIYTVPATWKEYTSDGLQYRKDLQKKFNLPEPNSIPNFEAYMDGIKKNMPGQALSMEYVQPSITGISFTAFELLSIFKYKWVYYGTPYGLVADYATPLDIKAYWGSAEFISDMKLMKTWADKGYWSRSALATKTDMTAFDNGKVVVIMQGQNAAKLGAAITNAETAHPGWEVGYVPYPSINGVAQVAHATQNGFAIPNSSQNPERAMMFYQKLVLDKTYNQLTEYGIEGKHYTVKNGYYEPIGDQTKSGFAREGMNGWAWRNEEFMLYPKSYEVVKSVFAQMDKIAKAQPGYTGINIFDGFAEDYTTYQNDRAALGTVLTQYLAPLEAGLVPDVDSAINTFMDQAKAAGLNKIQAEYIKQWKAYCELNNYK